MRGSRSGYPGHWRRNALLLKVFAGAIELAQLYTPRRHARWMVERLTPLRGS